MEHRRADILIIGSGLSGLMAAKYLTEHSRLRPLILSDGDGASPWVHGFCAPVCEGDSEQAFCRDTLESGGGVNRPELVQALCGDARTVLEEIEALGLRFNRQGSGYQLLRPLGSSFPRVVSIGNATGPAILEALRLLLKDRADIQKGRALRLRKEDGRIAGALVYDTLNSRWITVSARAVILACGGFCGIYPFSTNKRDSGGDGVAMAYEAGCRLTDMEFIQFEPSAAVWPPSLRGTSVITTLFYEGAVLRDREGRRFLLEADPEKAERVNKDVMARHIAEVIEEGRGTVHGGVYFDAVPVGKETLAARYSSYVERYRRVGMDISQEMMEVAPAPHTALGGVLITPEGRTDVPGLYACGEVAGGIHGANRLGGNAGLETLVFGRRAGMSCAADAEGPGWIEKDDAADWDRWALGILGEAGCGEEETRKLRVRMGRALEKGAGVLRSAKGLQEALAALQDVRRQANLSKDDAFARLRLLNDLTAAELVCRGALLRRESLGCHTRTDVCAAAQAGRGSSYRLVQFLEGSLEESLEGSLKEESLKGSLEEESFKGSLKEESLKKSLKEKSLEESLKEGSLKGWKKEEAEE